MKKKIMYRIMHIGEKLSFWDADKKRWVHAGLLLYITNFNDLESVFKEVRRVKRMCPGWADDIYIDSVLKWVEFE